VRRYLVTLRLDGTDHIAIWHSGDHDRIELDEAGLVRTLASEAAARATSDISRATAPLYDFDAIEAWCHSPATVSNCVPLLDAWNLLGDLPTEANVFTRADKRADAIYDKLFWGCNLPAMTPPGEHYVPEWTVAEVTALKQLLLLGLAELRSRLPASR
jgi:hypothetical protein